jgi:putative transposase
MHWPADALDATRRRAQASLRVQSVKTQQGGPRGFDGAKKLQGRNRHLLAEMQEQVLKVLVHSAAVHYREGARLLLTAIASALPRLARIWAHLGDTGALCTWAQAHFGSTLKVVSP